jgi:hypothetical protein
METPKIIDYQNIVNIQGLKPGISVSGLAYPEDVCGFTRNLLHLCLGEPPVKLRLGKGVRGRFRDGLLNINYIPLGILEHDRPESTFTAFESYAAEFVEPTLITKELTLVDPILAFILSGRLGLSYLGQVSQLKKEQKRLFVIDRAEEQLYLETTNRGMGNEQVTLEVRREMGKIWKDVNRVKQDETIKRAINRERYSIMHPYQGGAPGLIQH